MDYRIQLDEDFDIKVGAHTIHIKMVTPEHDGLGDNHGIWLPSKYTIYLLKKDPYSVKLSTFLHELIHVFEAFYEIKISHKDLNLVGDMLTMVLMENFKVEPKKPPTRRKKKR